MPVMAINELADGAHLLFPQLFQCELLACDAKHLRRESSVKRSFCLKFLTLRRQGFVLPAYPEPCQRKELPQQAQRQWFAATDRPKRHWHVVRLETPAHQRKPPSTQLSSSKVR